MSAAADRARAVQRAAARFNAQVGKAAGGGVRLSINDDDAADTRGFDRVFVGLGATLAAMPDVLRVDALPVIREAFAENFDREGGREAWASLAPRTQRERARLGYGPRHPILKRTGALRRHVTMAPATIARTSGGVELRIAPGNVVAGRPKYRALAKGTGNMPARPMVVLTPSASNRVAGAISRALRNRAAQNGLTS